MRLFDDDKIGCYLDDIGHRVEKTKDSKELRMVDLTLRVQPFGPERATSLHPDVRALLFNMNDATQKPLIKTLELRLTVPNQALTVFALPESEAASIAFFDVEISGTRARTEKGVDGYGLVFYASFGPVGAQDLDYVCAWHTQQRFVTFQPQAPALDFAGKAEAAEQARHPRRHPRSSTPVQSGDELRPGVHAEH